VIAAQTAEATDREQAPPPRSPVGRLVRLARRHAALLVLLVLAAAARAVVTLAYATALWFPDSATYVSGSQTMRLAVDRPWGYSAFLRFLDHFVSFRSVVAVQHLLGLLVVVLLYALLQRRGVSRWASVLAVVPVALDAYVLDIEQFLLAESLFLFLLAAAVTALLWQRRPGPLVLAGVGLLVGVLAVTRTAGVPVAALLALYLLVRLALRTVRWTAVVAFALAVAAVLVPYASWFDSQHGSFALTDYTGHFLYGRVADFVRCDRIDVPERLRPLCPTGPPGQRPTADSYVWTGISPANATRDGVPVWSESDLEQFALAAIAGQPGDYAGRVLAETGHYLVPGRESGPQDTCPLWWQFPVPTATAPTTCTAVLAPGPFAWRPGLISVLRGYQRVGYTPGPVLGLCAVAGLAALVLRRREQRDRLDPALLSVLGLAMLVVPAATASFDYRYLLPALVVLPPAAALALRGVSRWRPGRPAGR
jgi:hypothetical protein